MIRAIIVEDNPQIRDKNKKLIQENCLDVQIVGEADSVASAIEVISVHLPDLVFLDIEIVGGTGFDVLTALSPVSFKVIFITGYQEFALDAFRFSAIDYLVKPINSLDLKAAVEKAKIWIKQSDWDEQLKVLLAHISPTKADKKIILSTAESIHSIDVKDIIRCESDKNYTVFFLSNGRKLVISNTLKVYDKLLSPYGFFRVHQSHLINIDFFDHYIKKDGGIVVLKDSAQIPLSSAKREEFIEYLSSR